MKIIELQRRIAEAGRIRIGEQVPSQRGKRPSKLDTFRLTSPTQELISQAAKLYGGTPREWTDAPVKPQWEVTTKVDALPVIVPPGLMSFSEPVYELWSAGGCQRRCDMETDAISGGECLCDPNARECKLHTRLSVFLPDLKGFGLWRIDTQGYYAACELSGAVELIDIIREVSGRQLIPATLYLRQKMVKRGNQTFRFNRPVLEPEGSLGQLLAAGTVAIEPSRNGAPVATAVDATVVLDDDEPPPEDEPTGYVTPVAPTGQPAWPRPSIAEQFAVVNEPSTRRKRAAPIPVTGLAVRTAAQFDAGEAATRQAINEEPGKERVLEPAGPSEGNPLPDAPPSTPPGGEASDGPAPPKTPMITQRMLTKLCTALGKLGYKTDDEVYSYLTVSIGREIYSRKDLTKAEGITEIDKAELLEDMMARLEAAGFTDDESAYDYIAAALGEDFNGLEDMDKTHIEKVVNTLAN